MGWTLHRWTWVLEGPLFVGFTPSGSLNRCRIYIPARTIWGAVTAEAARNRAQDVPDYNGVGDTLKRDARFSYFYPAERLGDRWLAWLPCYEDARGLCWRREDNPSEAVPDRAFRRELLTTRPGTAIDPCSDSAADGSLRETECVCDRWRGSRDGEERRVAYVGYVFTQTTTAKDYVASVGRLFLGGDTRYGLGRVRRAAFDLVKGGEMFGGPTNLAADAPCVESDRVLGHAYLDGGRSMTGALELVGGWERDRDQGRSAPRALDERAPYWQPGSRSDGMGSWTIEPEGTWMSIVGA
jgi:hypothetical protein